MNVLFLVFTRTSPRTDYHKMASEERKDEDLLARNMEQLDLRDPDEAQAVSNRYKFPISSKHSVAQSKFVLCKSFSVLVCK